MSKRDPSLDIFRGLCIAEVLLHHSSAFAIRKTAEGSFTHVAYMALNRTLHFAVPAFLFIMGVILVRTMLGDGRTWREFYTRRAQQTLLPYLLWSLFYALFRVLTSQDTPEVLMDPGRWRVWLVWGKAYYHLYFLVVALQLYVAFPFVMRTLQRIPVGLGAVLVAGAMAQLAAYWVHCEWIRSYYPSTLLLWHVMPAVAGVWVGLHLEQWDETWRWLRWLAVPMALAGWASYLWQALPHLQGLPVNGFIYQLSYWIFTTGMVFCLLAFAKRIAAREGRIAWGFGVLGVQSMQIYLVHPMLLHAWAVAEHSGTTLAFHLTTMRVTLSALLFAMAVSWVAARLCVSKVLFGRDGAGIPGIPLRSAPGLGQGTHPSPRTRRM